MIYQHGTARLDPLPPPAVPRAEVIDELYDGGHLTAGRYMTAPGPWRRWKSASRSCSRPAPAQDSVLQHQVGLP